MAWDEAQQRGDEGENAYVLTLTGTDVLQAGVELALPRVFHVGTLVVGWSSQTADEPPAVGPVVTWAVYDQDPSTPDLPPIAVVNAWDTALATGGSGCFEARSRSGRLWFALLTGAPPALTVTITVRHG
jgi:hypothetical protein